MSLHEKHSTLKEAIQLSDLARPLEVCARYSKSIEREKLKHEQIENHRESIQGSDWLLSC